MVTDIHAKNLPSQEFGASGEGERLEASVSGGSTVHSNFMASHQRTSAICWVHTLGREQHGAPKEHGDGHEPWSSSLAQFAN